jgi:hypothetical protein
VVYIGRDHRNREASKKVGIALTVV